MSETTLPTFNDTGNGRINQTDNRVTLHRTIALSSLIISLLGLAGNGVVIWFLGFWIKRNPITVYILNLAVADFFLLLCQSIWLLFLLFDMSKAECTRCIKYFFIYIEVIFNLGFRTSLLFLVTISMERCIAVVFPIWYKCRRPRHLSVIICFLIWPLAFTEAMLMMIICSYLPSAYWSPHCYRVYWSYSIITFGIISPLMILSSLVLIIRVQRKSIKRQPKRLYRAIVLNLLVFLVCTFPTRLVKFLIAHHIPAITDKDFFLLSCVDDLFICVNSCANPFIYFLVGRDKKRISGKSIVVALCRVFGSDKEEHGQDETQNPPGSRTMELELSE